ncbi:MAG: single-stranded-DNA-specific exonuclease RecJ [Chloroflexi bacterium]|nr:single-stranded-DNA-specific exonuclease RecJ [Chloroflexota bacterium]
MTGAPPAEPVRAQRWLIREPVPSEVRERYPDLTHPVVQVLYARGLTEHDQVQTFLSPDPLSQLGNPFALRDMNKAVDQVRRALKQGQPIAVFGDFDADGVTGTALLTQALQALGGKVIPYIPHRLNEGYGLNIEAVDQLAAQGARLMITVDCGISSVKEITHARKKGLSVIVTDHHHVPAQCPPAQAIVNPKQVNEQQPWSDLAGVGLAFKLAQALLRVEKRLPIAPRPVTLTERDLLDLVALGTVADLAPLTAENRALVRAGLEVLNAAARPGLRALIAQAGLQPGQITAGHIGFQLGPRLNAAGRLDTAQVSLDLLLCTDEEQAATLAAELDRRNRERQQLTGEAQARARQEVLDEEPLPYLLFVTGDEYPAGIVGLVASRLTEEFYRPSVVVEVGPADGISRGSCRSIPEFHIAQALQTCSDLLERHGGHAAAAGFSVQTARLDDLRQRLQALAAEQLAGASLVPGLKIDGALPLADMGGETYRQLQQLAPFGMANHTPTFASYGVQVRRHKTVGREGAHLKLTVSDETATWDAIGFRLGHWAGHLPARIDLAYTLDLNEWNGRESLQLVIKDLRPATTAP